MSLPSQQHGALPVFGWNHADCSAYATRRQLAAARLRHGGPVVALLVWRKGKQEREAHLYLRSDATPKPLMTWPQVEALAKALATHPDTHAPKGAA